MTHEGANRLAADLRGLGDHRYHGLVPDTEKMVFGDDYDEPTTSLAGIAGKWEVCGTCEGKGKHVNPDIDSQGISSEDFGQDPDFAEDYFSGIYDVRCYECKGRTTSFVVDWGALTAEQRKELESRLQEATDSRAEQLAELRMGC